MLNSDVLYEKIGKRIKELREGSEAQMSQQQLADILGLTRTSITNIEQGNQKITLDTVYKFCEHFRIDVAEFLPAVDSVVVPEQSVHVEIGDKWHELTPKVGAVVKRLTSHSTKRR